MSCDQGLVRVIPPITITDLMLTSTNVVDAVYADYDAATTYQVGDFVVSGHVIYECQSADTLGVYPPDNLATWTDRGAVNSRQMFDSFVGSQTENADYIEVVLTPGTRIDALALLGVSAKDVHVTVGQVGAETYNESFEMVDYSNITNWYDYLYSDIQEQSTLIITDLPPSSGIITVRIEKTGGIAKVGTLAIGKQIIVGDLLYGYSVGYKSYSKKVVNDDGLITVQAGNKTKIGQFPVEVESQRIDYLLKTLHEYNDTPAIYIGGTLFDSQSIYGYYESLEMIVPNAVHAKYNMKIQGII